MTFQEFINKYQKVPVEEYPNNVLEKIPHPLVSCRVSTYQHAPYIKQCLDGILMQKTDFPFEIVIGEDESSDGTREICIEYAQKYPDIIRLFLHKRENNILIDGKPTPKFQANFTIFHLRGNYLAMCEGDDYWTDPLKLQKQVELLVRYKDASTCVALHKEIDIVTNEVQVSSKYERKNSPLLYFDDFDYYFHPNTRLIRKCVSDKILYNYELLILADTVLMYLLLNEGPFVVLNDIVSVYRKTGKGVWTTLDSEKQLKQNIKIFQNLRKFHLPTRRKYFARKEIELLYGLIFCNFGLRKIKRLYYYFPIFFVLIIKYDQLFIWRHAMNFIVRRFQSQKKSNSYI